MIQTVEDIITGLAEVVQLVNPTHKGTGGKDFSTAGDRIVVWNEKDLGFDPGYSLMG